MEDNKERVYFLVNEARGYLTDAVGQIMNKFGLPAYIMDGLLSDVLAEVRKKEIYDMSVINMKRENSNGEHLESDRQDTKRDD